MPTTRYKIWQIGSAIDQGATDSYHVGIAGVAKGASDTLPFVVSNEFICGRLAQAAMLPVPPGFLIEKDGKPHYVSLNFNLSGEDLPPANIKRLAQRQPQIATGITVFDIWVVNDDRHRQNLAYDEEADQIQMFDHSHAFYRGDNPRQRLEDRRDSLGIGGHSIAGALTSFAGATDWIERINQIPEFVISETVSEAGSLGLPPDDIDFCIDYLHDRRQRLRDLMNEHRDSFPNIQPELWDDLEGGRT